MYIYTISERAKRQNIIREETTASIFALYTIAREYCPLLLKICDFLVELIEL